MSNNSVLRGRKRNPSPGETGDEVVDAVGNVGEIKSPSPKNKKKRSTRKRGGEAKAAGGGLIKTFVEESPWYWVVCVLIAIAGVGVVAFVRLEYFDPPLSSSLLRNPPHLVSTPYYETIPELKDRIEAFFEWARDGLYVDTEKVKLRWLGEWRGHGLVTHSGVMKEDILFWVAEDIAFHWGSPHAILAQLYHDYKDHFEFLDQADSSLLLAAVSLMVERGSPQSFWKPYLDTLPELPIAPLYSTVISLYVCATQSVYSLLALPPLALSLFCAFSLWGGPQDEELAEYQSDWVPSLKNTLVDNSFELYLELQPTLFKRYPSIFGTRAKPRFNKMVRMLRAVCV